MRIFQATKRQLTKQSGSVLLIALIAATAISMQPLANAAVSDAGTVAIEGNIQVPAGFPSAGDRFIPEGAKKNAYRAFYSRSGAETWDNWTSADAKSKAVDRARKTLGNSGQYTQAYVENTATGEVIWTSWKNR